MAKVTHYELIAEIDGHPNLRVGEQLLNSHAFIQSNLSDRLSKRSLRNPEQWWLLTCFRSPLPNMLIGEMIVTKPDMIRHIITLDEVQATNMPETQLEVDQAEPSPRKRVDGRIVFGIYGTRFVFRVDGIPRNDIAAYLTWLVGKLTATSTSLNQGEKLKVILKRHPLEYRLADDEEIIYIRITGGTFAEDEDDTPPPHNEIIRDLDQRKKPLMKRWPINNVNRMLKGVFQTARGADFNVPSVTGTQSAIDVVIRPLNSRDKVSAREIANLLLTVPDIDFTIRTDRSTISSDSKQMNHTISMPMARYRNFHTLNEIDRIKRILTNEPEPE